MLCILSAVILSSCSSGRSKSPTPETLQANVEAPVNSGQAERGLELRVLTVDDSQNRVAQTLARYQDSDSGIKADDREIWDKWGLRWIALPIEELEAFTNSQEMVQAMQNRWMGELPRWRPIIRTGELRNNPVRIGDASAYELVSIDGRPRLLVRAWTTPELTATGAQARLHVDLAVQLTKPQSRSSVWQPTGIPSVLSEGDLITELRTTRVLDGSTALVLVGVDPSDQWIQDEIDGSVAVQSAAQSSRGPETPLPRTLGQRMLSTPGTGSVAPGMRYVPPRKVVIVLIPKTGGAYQLLNTPVAGMESPQ